MADEFAVFAVEAVVGGPSTFILAKNSPDRWILASNSFVVQGAMLAALLTGSLVSPEIMSGTKVIKRIPAFEKGGGHALSGFPDYHVARIATQRTADGDHLEVFVTQGSDKNQTPYNVYDQFLQQLLLASFQHPQRPPEEIPLTIGVENGELVSVRMGIS